MLSLSPLLEPVLPSTAVSSRSADDTVREGMGRWEGACEGVEGGCEGWVKWEACLSACLGIAPMLTLVWPSPLPAASHLNGSHSVINNISSLYNKLRIHTYWLILHTGICTVAREVMDNLTELLWYLYHTISIYCTWYTLQHYNATLWWLNSASIYLHIHQTINALTVQLVCTE